MSWFKLDDGFAHHPKVMMAGNAATGLFVRCGAYCARYETDGHVPLGIAQSLGSRRELDTLLDVELWVVNGDGGLLIPDYLDYNPSHEHQEAKRAADRERIAAKRRDERGQFDG